MVLWFYLFDLAYKTHKIVYKMFVLETEDGRFAFYELKEYSTLIYKTNVFIIKLFKPMTVIGLIGFTVGILAFVSNRKHVLNILLRLEYIVLAVIWMIRLFLLLFDNYHVVLYFLVFVVCEGSLGLSLVVVLIRSYGNDLLLNLNLAQC